MYPLMKPTSVNTDATDLLARRLKVLGEPVRMRIICRLFSEAPVCVSSIAEEIGESVATISHHLRVLADEGLLEPVRDGKHVCYRLTATPFTRDIKRLVCKYRA